MNMKRMEISRLMDEYQDNEFFPEEGSSAGTQAVKDRVLAQARPGKKRRIPVKGLLLAAALSAACLLCIAAALPIIAYRQVDGSSVLVQTDGEHYLYIAYDNSEWDEPLVLEDGRLWLVVGGQRTDVTDLIDEETPFIVEGADPKSGLKSYLIVGGTPEDFGWEQWSEMPLGGYMGGGWGCYDTIVTIDDVEYNYNDLTEEQLAQGYSSIHEVDKPWCLNGREMLHLWD